MVACSSSQIPDVMKWLLNSYGSKSTFTIHNLYLNVWCLYRLHNKWISAVNPTNNKKKKQETKRHYADK